MRPSGGNAQRYVVGLYRVSTAEQGNSGLGLEPQQASVRAFVAARGWTLVAEFSDVASGKDDRRPGFQAALARCRQLGAVLPLPAWTGSRVGRKPLATAGGRLLYASCRHARYRGL